MNQSGSYRAHSLRDIRRQTCFINASHGMSARAGGGTYLMSLRMNDISVFYSFSHSLTR